MAQISWSGGYKLVERVEGGVQVDQDILKRTKMIKQEMKAEEKRPIGSRRLTVVTVPAVEAVE